MPTFEARSWGLRHRPELQQDAIASMVEQLLREARDPREQFMVTNFSHYLKCLCADNFMRTLRQEGLSYRRDDQGNPQGRPRHVPHVLVDSISHMPSAAPFDEETQAWDIADNEDPLEEQLAELEAKRILSRITDPVNRTIVELRVFGGLQWEEIATICGMSERTMRLRYNKTRAQLQNILLAEADSQTHATAV